LRAVERARERLETAKRQCDEALVAAVDLRVPARELKAVLGGRNPLPHNTFYVHVREARERIEKQT